MRKVRVINNELYHILNRGIDKRKIFNDHRDYERFLLGMNLLNCEQPGNMLKWRDFQKNPKAKPWENFQRLSLEGALVEIVAYCLNPNHFHFILRQKKEDGISSFMQRLSTAYTMYFNKKNKRSGSLFQGPFKSVHIESNEYLLYLSAYINCNNFIHGYNKKAENWPYSSYLDYVGKREGKLCNKESILKQFDNDFDDYEKFCNMNAEYLRDKKEFSKYLLE